MTSCSPAEWGLSRDGLCRARTGAPRWGDPNPPPQTQAPRRGHVEYWKAQCEETRMLRLEGGKERKLLPILTVSANCYGTKWHRRRGSNRNDVDDQKSRQSKPSCRPNVRASDRVFGLWFVFARGSYARPPVSVAVPLLLISADFMASQYCYSIEMKQA